MSKPKILSDSFIAFDTPLLSVLDQLQLIEETSVTGRSKGPSN
jgi:hypothetical protein